MWGLDRLSGGQLSSTRRRLRNAPCAVLTHSAAVDRRGQQTLKVLEELGIQPKVVFSPEHGLAGVAQAEEPVATESHEGLTVVSLYGNDKSSLTPAAEHFSGVGTLVIDLVDVGSRYYTYAWTALLAARAAAEAGVHTIVLDRPNPLGTDPACCEGKPQEEGFTSFVGLEPIPIRHGLTIGELLSLFLAQDSKTLGPDGALSVVNCWGWERLQTAAAWGRPFVPPSPNMPSAETTLLYPGGCLVEGTNLSEGRGTAFPFRVVGAPFLDGEALARSMLDAHLPGVMVRPTCFRPSFEKHSGRICNGVMLHVTDPRSFRPVTTYLTLLSLARAQAPDEFQFRKGAYEFELDHPAFDLLTGSSKAREALENQASANDLVELVVPVDPSYSEVLAAAEAAAEKARA